MIPRIASIIDHIVDIEGPFNHRKADTGGATAFGITIATLSKERGRQVSVEEVRNLTKEEARQIYYRRYVLDHNFEKIAEDDLCAFVVDCGVQFGQDEAAEWLQTACNMLGSDLKVDGICGPRTIEAVNSKDPRAVYLLVLSLRLRKRGRVIADDARRRGHVAAQAQNAHGWANRDADYLVEFVHEKFGK